MSKGIDEFELYESTVVTIASQGNFSFLMEDETFEIDKYQLSKLIAEHLAAKEAHIEIFVTRETWGEHSFRFEVSYSAIYNVSRWGRRPFATPASFRKVESR